MAKSLSKSLLLLTRTLHIYLSTLALLLLMFFAVTGFIMNHGEWFGVEKPTEADITTTVPDADDPASGAGPRQQAVVDFLRGNQGIHGEAEGWSETDDPIHLVFKTPRFRYEVNITRADGKTALHKTTFSTTPAFWAKLHKGDDTGAAWHRIIDATSILLAVISITGLILWLSLAKRRVLGIISLAACVVIVVAVFWACVP